MNIFSKKAALRLLIVAEDKASAKDQASFLSTQNYSVKITDNIAEATLIATEFNPQLALIDLKLNHQNGIDLLDQLIIQNPEIRCLMLSDHVEIDSALISLRHGAADYLNKSLPQDKLLLALEHAAKKIKFNQHQEQKINNIHTEVLFQNIADGILIHDEQGYIYDANHAILTQLDYTKEELKSLTVFDIETGETRERLLNLWQSCKQGNPVFVNGRKQRKDGSSFPVEVKITTYIENDKKYLLAIVRDITQRKEALEQQAETSKRLKRKADQLAFQKRALDEHAIVSITDVKGNIIYVNDKFESISQYSQDEVIGKNHRLLKSGFHPKSFFKEMWQTISSGKAWHGEIKNKAKDGSEYWVKSTIVPLLNDQGIPEQYIAIRTDVTYIKDLETRQEDINKALLIAKEIAEQEKANAEKASQAKSEFLSAMSHELRTPLNSILGFSQLLESDTEEPLTEDQNDSVGYIIAGGKHLLALINEILELSSIEAGKVELSIEPILLNDIINESLPLLNTIAETTNIEIRLLTNLSTSVQADYTKLKQVLLNLISNAIKYNKDGGSVSIDWQHTEDDFVRISITDTGIGISETNQDHVFGAFNRLGQEKSAIEGTGVGLVVTKSLVELMAGRIGFDSQENIGTTFWFELPTGEAENPPQTQQTIMVDNTFQTIETEYLDARPEKQILCVEDNAANRRLMQSFFNHKKGYTLHFAETGELGWEMITKQDFDLILMDIHLPGINGKELTNRLKEQTALKHIPVIAVTAAAMLHDIDNNKDLFDAYITKPIQFAALNDALKKYL